MPEKLPISVIILTYNEERNLPQALDNVTPHVDEVVVVDSYSEDDTPEIAKEYDVKFHQHEFVNYADQFNWALDNVDIANDWIMKLDADEWVTDELWEELEEKLPNVSDDVSGFEIKRRVYFMGKWIKHGSYYPTWILRLWRKGKGRLEKREMDEHTVISEGRVERLENDFVDENHKDLSWWIDKHNNYATREMDSVFKKRDESVDEKSLGKGSVTRRRWLKKNIYMKLPKFCRAFLYFIYRYIFRLGFLDGKEGLIFHFLQGCWYRFLVDAKLYEKEKKGD